MTLIDTFLLTAALVTSGIGVAVLFFSWSKLEHHKIFARLSALLFGYISYLAFKAILGWEFALVLIIIIPVLFAWVFTLSNRKFKQQKTPVKRTQVVKEKVDWVLVLKNIWMFIIAVPIALIASILFSTVMAHHLPMAELNRMVLASFSLPVLWGALCSWVLADGQFKKSSLITVMITVVSYSILYLI